LGSIPVRVDFSFWLMAAILGFGGDTDATHLGIWVAVVFVSVLIHELGHALAYLSRGATAQVFLYGGGGLTMGRREGEFGMGERIYTALAGPVVGMLFGGAVYLFVHVHGPVASPLGQFAIRQLLWVNLLWGAFNLLPIVPMDGGHVLEALLCLKSPDRGRVWARYVGIGLCAVLAPVSFYFGYVWGAMLLALFAVQAYQTLPLVDPARQAELQKRVTAQAPPPEAPEVIDNLSRLHKLLADDEPEQARAVAHQVLNAARGAGARDTALRALAWLAIGHGQAQEALDYLAKTSPRFDDPLTWGTAIAASGDAMNALPHLARAYQRSADPQTVATYARCLAAVGRSTEARFLASAESPVEVQRALGEALFRSRDFQAAAEISRRLFERTRQSLDAYNLACAETRMGHDDEGLRWLASAVDAGFHDRAHLQDDPDLAPLRVHAEWDALLDRVPSEPAAS